MARKNGQHHVTIAVNDVTSTYTTSVSFSNAGEARGDWRLTAVVTTQNIGEPTGLNRYFEVRGLISKNEDNAPDSRWVFFLEGNRQLALPGSFHSFRSLGEAVEGAAKLLNQTIGIRWSRIDALHAEALVINELPEPRAFHLHVTQEQADELTNVEPNEELLRGIETGEYAAIENDIVIRALRRREARRQAALELAPEAVTATAVKERHTAPVEVISAAELGRRLQAGEQLALANLGPITAHDVQGVLVAVEVDVRRWSPATGTPFQQRQLLSFHAADDVFLA